MPKEFSKNPRNAGHHDRPDRFGPRNGKAPQRKSLAEEIIEADADLIRLLARRARLTVKMRGGKTHAATPGAIRGEKAIRSHWEAEAGKISRDSRFIRQLFNLIQDIAVRPQDSAPAGPAFNLAPARGQVKLDLPGPALAEQAMLWAALAAACGCELRVNGVQRSQGLMDFVKAFSQAGANLVWADSDTGSDTDSDPASSKSALAAGLLADSLELSGCQPIRLAHKTIFVGESRLAFYLLAFLSLNAPGKIRFTAGHALKSADFTALHKLLPGLGARLSFAVPASRGLPAALECSGALPELYVIPADLPLEGTLALLLAGFAWRRPLVLSLDNLPGSLAQQALSLLEPFFARLPEAAEVKGSEVHYNAWTPSCAQSPQDEAEGHAQTNPVTFPTVLETALDPALSCLLLSLPFFSGGSVKLAGSWPENPEAPACVSLLRLAGLKLEIGSQAVSSGRAGNISLADGIICQDLPAKLLPLFWAMNAQTALQSKNGLTLSHAPEQFDPANPGLPLKPDLDLARDFLAQLGVELTEGESGLRLTALPPEEFREVAAKSYGWSSPDAFWTIGLSLGAFFCSNLKLSNPDSASDLLPDYWTLYNALPDPGAKAEANRAAVTPAGSGRRRIMTDSVIEPPEALDEEEDF
ncbi:MAG: hypothetical protein LBV80_03110 [Deltaproteobacteria bacterium]|nr:hypothetical protein [Deltaproteobacteria bacterium]